MNRAQDNLVLRIHIHLHCHHTGSVVHSRYCNFLRFIKIYKYIIVLQLMIFYFAHPFCKLKFELPFLPSMPLYNHLLLSVIFQQNHLEYILAHNTEYLHVPFPVLPSANHSQFLLLFHFLPDGFYQNVLQQNC